MMLESARIENFKCIDDSTEFTIRPLTGIVGKNESGKTALLKALYRVNPILPVDGNFSDVEYPRRRWAAYRQTRQQAPDRVISTRWTLDDRDVEAVEAAIGPDALGSRRVLVSKGYDNTRRWQIDVDERRVVSNLVRAARFDAADLQNLWSITTIASLARMLAEVPNPSVAQVALAADLRTRFPGGTAQDAAAAVLDRRLPRFLYFADYHRLPATVSIDELLRRKAADQLTVVDSVFLALLELANTSAEDLAEIDQFEYLVAELESVSQRITRDVLAYWTQDRSLGVEFRCDAARPNDPPPFNSGYVLRTRIRNTRHNVTLSFDERSSGFIWFFSFLVWLSHIRREPEADYVILLDEPGLSLHARAQMDMMRFIREQLLPRYQVIYTTHSPFMIDPEFLDGVRTVEDASANGVVLGTKVGDRFLSNDQDTSFPIRAALAYDVARRAVLGPQTLLLDRASDVLYLKWFSRELQQQGRAHLDPSWSLVPIGGLDSIGPFAALFANAAQKIVVLTDGLMSHPRRLEGLWERGVLQFGRILRPALYVDREDAQLEDMLGRALFRELVIGAFNLDRVGVLPNAAPADAPVRVVAEVEQLFASMPPWAPKFDSFGPASYLFEHAAELREALPDLDGALDRFEKLFRDLSGIAGE
ncbi:MAG: AAA family ATPase [Acidobacteriota bacterium]